MTANQLKLLRFMARYQADKQVSPTLEEMRLALRLSSKSNVHYLLQHLLAQRRIRRNDGSARAYEVIQGPPEKGVCPACAQRMAA